MASLRGAAFYFIPAVALLAGCGAGSPRFTSRDRAVVLSAEPEPSSRFAGVASYYADDFNGRRTASGEVYDMNGMTAAHRTLPFGTKVKVTNVDTGKYVIVRINDRGPFKDDRVIDLSLGAAKQLGLISMGTARVILQIVELGIQSK
jgi:rare lipoprotein A